LSIGTIICPPTTKRKFDKVKRSVDGFPLRAMRRLDDLDVRIIKELGSPSSLQWNVRETYSSIAKRVGVDEETVRRRLKRAEELGSLPGWRMMVNPRLIGCEAASLDLDVEDEDKKDSAIAAIRRVDGVIKILDFRGRGLQLALYYPNANALKRKTELIGSISGSPRSTVWELSFPSSRIRMTSMDWKIVQNMLDDARKSLDDVSQTVGISTRTVERRLTSMQKEFVVYLQGTPNFKVLAGLSCVFLVFTPDGKKKRTVDRIILSKTPRTELANTASRQYSTFVMLFDNLSEADDFTKWITGLDGVESVRMGIMKDLIVVQDWLRDEIAKRIGTDTT
jgi:DNA-binding Lrp family transcriptional regulator